MDRTPRNPDITVKPQAAAWFTHHPEARLHFDPVLNLLLSGYMGDNHGYINKQTGPHYVFNAWSKEGNTVRVSCTAHYSRVRIRVDKAQTRPAFHPYAKTLANRDGSRRIEYIDLIIRTADDLQLLADFFSQHDIPGFMPSQPGNTSPDETDYAPIIRVVDGRVIDVRQLHNALAGRFTRSMQMQGYACRHEHRLANTLDRVDVLLSRHGLNIYCELKPVAGSSTKREIRAALGQLLDYQYYNKSVRADALWIVLDAPCNTQDTAFIAQIRDQHQLPLTLVWEEHGTFRFYPALA